MKTNSARPALRRLHIQSIGPIAIFFCSLGAASQQRPPAVPLIAHNPYFSIWSTADKLTDRDTAHWTGARQPITGLARIDGKTYRFMGADPRELPAMEQVSLSVTPTHTIYQFRAERVALTLTFFTPAFPKDLDILSRPVTYLTATATGQGSHDVSILFDVDPVIAVNTEDEAVTWGRSRAGNLSVLNVAPAITYASTGATSTWRYRTKPKPRLTSPLRRSTTL
jgi:hypothetical protein